MPQATGFLTGAWSLLECAEILPDGAKRFPFGEHVLGQVVYTADGHMSVQMLRARRAAFASDDYMAVPDEIAAAAFRQYFGYFGRYRIDAGAGTVTHVVEGAWLPNLENTIQVRTFRFEDDRLILEAPTPWGFIRNTWTRATGR